MDAIERMLIEHECGRLVTAYCHHVDHGDAAQVNIYVVYPPGVQDLPKVRFAVDFLAERWRDLV